ncbi:malignant T-cell-amplified sequence 1 homolog [Brevipalpus obovatus]|uniref:malignant T-cell-amplified sequence 1 homolog n=1 Tax=Brevipalpus obovatus TaxID=246614 RepID=UPI003D9F8833
MFKRFDDSSVSGTTQLKSSVQKGIRNKIVEQYPAIEEYIDEILPKKESLKIVKCSNRIEILINEKGEHLFFHDRDEPYMPSLKLIHKYPTICPLMQVDSGAIQFVLQGANIMCPGLTSKGAIMTPNLFPGTIVTIIAQGKQHALAVGVMKMSTGEIGSINKGVAVENIHYLNDGLWRLKPIR